MNHYCLSFTLESNAIFGRGDGVAGLVEREVAHDEFGFPYLDGRSLKGMLTEECDLLLETLSVLVPDRIESFQNARNWMFGSPGSQKQATGSLRFGPAQLPEDLRAAVINARMRPEEVLASLTSIQKQTAINAQNGAPEPHSLRASRVILRKTHFESQILAPRPLTNIESALLAASVMHWRRAGSLRNRGRGSLIASLTNDQNQSLLENGLKLLEVVL